MIDNVFPTPIFAVDLPLPEREIIHDEIANALPQIRQNKSLSLYTGRIESTFKFSDDGHVNDIVNFNLAKFHSFVTQAIHMFALNLNYKGNILKLDGSWFNFFDKGSFYHEHIHPGVKVAGVYYYKSDGVDGKLRFQNPNPHMYVGNWPADGTDEECIFYPPIEGRLMLWPAWLPHRVEIKKNWGERISIGVNFS